MQKSAEYNKLACTCFHRTSCSLEIDYQNYLTLFLRANLYATAFNSAFHMAPELAQVFAPLRLPCGTDARCNRLQNIGSIEGSNYLAFWTHSFCRLLLGRKTIERLRPALLVASKRLHSKIGPVQILLRNFGDGKRPGNSKSRIIIANTIGRLRRIGSEMR